jgi:hypothetical protein
MQYDPIVTDEVAERALLGAVKLVIHAGKRLLRPRKVPYLLQRLREHFDNEVGIFNIVDKEPEIKVLAAYELPPDRKRLVARKRKEIIAEKKAIEPHAILVNQPNWLQNPITLEVRTLDFAEIRALRDEQKGNLKPQILSANAVIICNETKEIILQERSSKVDTEKGKVHTLGGSFLPRSSRQFASDFDHGKLTRTAAREIGEETELQINLEESPRLLLSKELSTGFIQIVLLGINISKSQLPKIRDNWEGRTLLIPFNDLPELLSDRRKWVATGNAHVLAWLGCGAPGASRITRFNKLTAHQLFNLIVGSE